ncbi:hypothetical protein JFL43_20190 [Viridibacillus sp. YIM B01967]|uniref:Uncharacterized protein n=1 Tax=Viridibacillus soli TaxID=2798301 RepID=A0ABS1HCG2_9BACL|nr:hypothetical protein [Viridibacillus soli]MBK3497110.1 hypothetical protein [Viridibacillus soli]
MANYSCTVHTLPTPQYAMRLEVCTSDDTTDVNLTLTQDDPNAGYVNNYTATLQRANKNEAWAEDVMSKSGVLKSSSTSNAKSNVTFGNIAKKGLPVRVKVKTDFGTYYSNTWIR